MADLVVAMPTSRRSVAELRGPLEAALDAALPPGMLQRRWEGDVLHVWGAGATGTITLEGGQLVARARLGLPASLVQQMVQERMEAALRAVT
jgi:hypothetical protein